MWLPPSVTRRAALRGVSVNDAGAVASAALDERAVEAHGPGRVVDLGTGRPQQRRARAPT